MDDAIHKLIASHDWSRVKQAILTENAQSRAQVGLGDDSDLSAMQLAALYRPDILDELVAHGLTIDLHSAAAIGNSKIIHELADESSLNIEAEYLTPLGFALIKSNEEGVATLLRAGDDVNRPLRRIGFFVWEIEVLDIAPWLPIHLTCTHGYFENGPALLQLLISHGADINSYSPIGAQPLHLTAIYGWVELTKVLLDQGVSIDSRTRDIDPQIWACSAPLGAEQSSEMTALMIAAQEGSAKTVESFLSLGADVSATDSIGNSALHHAANGWWGENVEVVELLLQAGASAKATNNQRRTPLSYGLERGYQEIVATLERNMRHSPNRRS